MSIWWIPGVLCVYLLNERMNHGPQEITAAGKWKICQRDQGHMDEFAIRQNKMRDEF